MAENKNMQQKMKNKCKTKSTEVKKKPRKLQQFQKHEINGNN